LRHRLEAFVGARELLDKTEIVECGGHVEEFRVKACFDVFAASAEFEGNIIREANFLPGSVSPSS
jgi:hypothetical protein